MAYAENILTLSYDFLKYLIPELSKFPRDQKFMLADRIQELTHDILDDLITAYYNWSVHATVQSSLRSRLGKLGGTNKSNRSGAGSSASNLALELF